MVSYQEMLNGPDPNITGRPFYNPNQQDDAQRQQREKSTSDNFTAIENILHPQSPAPAKGSNAETPQDKTNLELLKSYLKNQEVPDSVQSDQYKAEHNPNLALEKNIVSNTDSLTKNIMETFQKVMPGIGQVANPQNLLNGNLTKQKAQDLQQAQQYYLPIINDQLNSVNDQLNAVTYLNATTNQPTPVKGMEDAASILTLTRNMLESLAKSLGANVDVKNHVFDPNKIGDIDLKSLPSAVFNTVQYMDNIKKSYPDALSQKPGDNSLFSFMNPQGLTQMQHLTDYTNALDQMVNQASGQVYVPELGRYVPQDKVFQLATMEWDPKNPPQTYNGQYPEGTNFGYLMNLPQKDRDQLIDKIVGPKAQSQEQAIASTIRGIIYASKLDPYMTPAMESALQNYLPYWVSSRGLDWRKIRDLGQSQRFPWEEPDEAKQTTKALKNVSQAKVKPQPTLDQMFNHISSLDQTQLLSFLQAALADKDNTQKTKDTIKQLVKNRQAALISQPITMRNSTSEESAYKPQPSYGTYGELGF